MNERMAKAYWECIARTAEMVQDQRAQALVGAQGLQLVNLTWEDTARYKGSSVGPNISDMTIQVRSDPPLVEVRCMPVIRYPNFADVTADLDPRDVVLLVGNEKGQPLQRISLHDFLAEPTLYLHDPDSWPGQGRQLLCARDTRVLVSAQACFLPVPQQGMATFNPVLFNYTSRPGDPAVLTLLATREGSSVTVIDNVRDAFGEGRAWGQRLFFNDDGQRASLTGERESDFLAQEDAATEESVAAAGASGLNMVLLVQIPLEQKEELTPPFSSLFASKDVVRGPADVEDAVIGHGVWEGPFTEIDGLDIVRDERYPVRVTVQFYKATANGIIEASHVAAIKAQIDAVYAQGETVGSLVTQGETGRVTEYAGAKVQPPGWWAAFWQRYESYSGETREAARQRLRELLGSDYQEQPVCDLYLRLLLRGGNGSAEN